MARLNTRLSNTLLNLSFHVENWIFLNIPMDSLFSFIIKILGYFNKIII
jgi:hypothetical protein